MDVRVATMAEVEHMIDWAAAEGWNPGIGDAAAFRDADPEGFLVAVDDGGDLIGCASAVRYTDAFGFFGLFITRADMRGRGIGRTVSAAVLERLGDLVSGLDGVVAQQPTYRTMGFDLAHRNVRYVGDPGDIPGPTGVRPLDPSVDDITPWEERCFPAPRENFLRTWLAPADGRQALVHAGAHGIDGYAVVRACRTGWKVGPLFADTPDAADHLLRGCAQHARATAPGAIALDVPEPHHEAVALAERYGMAPVFETARMYRGGVPDLDLSAIFGITTFELG
jgi:GNAT superfamily N-acetyltransferase